MTTMLQDFQSGKAEVTPPLFTFGGSRGFLVGRGAAQPVKRGNASTIAERVQQAFSTAKPDAAIGGALPFDTTADDYLWLTERLSFEPQLRDEPAECRVKSVQQDPPAQHYGDSVTGALRVMERESGPNALRKIVLARSLVVTTEQPISMSSLLSRLSLDPAATAYQVALPNGADSYLIGATPELLVEKTGKRVSSFPLAGSARRSPDPVKDAAAVSGLASSEKDQREHAMVVEFILDTLTPYCRDLVCPEGTGLTSTRSMWHLGTRIDGTLKDDSIPSIVLAGLLHPTPAVCGLPRNKAAELIGQLEAFERGFYAGAVGWSNYHGDGAWYVAIRCAEVAGNAARLFAGAGIVPGSTPEAETAETDAKFGALLRALGLPPEAGR